MTYSPLSPVCALLAIVLLLAGASGAQAAALTRQDRNRKLTESQAERKQMLEKMDKAGLCSRSAGVTVQPDDDMLKAPAHIPPLEGVSIAKAAPTVDLTIVPLDPRFFYEPPPPRKDGGLWTVWGQGTYYPANGKLYGAVGNHEFYDSRLHLFEYDPKAKRVQTFRELNSFAGLPIDYGDGKIHGTLDFYNGPTIYFLTYWTEYPAPKEKQFQQGYEGGRLMSFNVNTRKARDLGVPMKRTSWQLHKMDTNRGLLFAVGAPWHEFLCYDIKNNKMLFGGYLPDGMKWYERALFVDDQTGCAYASNRSGSDSEVHIIQYDSTKNRFTKMKSCVPAIEKAGEGNQIRAATQRKLKDGAFICISRWGRMFKFYPEQDRVKDLGPCWSAEPSKLYTASIAVSPDDRYIYYIPAAHGGSHELGSPVVQYNVTTGERKAIAFLFPFLYEKYGYITGGTFSVSMDEKGERLFIIMNGAFNEWKKDGGDVFGDPSVIVVHIPESERR